MVVSVVRFGVMGNWTRGARSWRVIVARDVCCDTNNWFVLSRLIHEVGDGVKRAGLVYQVRTISIYRRESLSAYSKTDMK